MTEVEVEMFDILRIICFSITHMRSSVKNDQFVIMLLVELFRIGLIFLPHVITIIWIN